MLQESTDRRGVSARQHPVGVRRMVYWCGRVFQGIGLLLIWSVLLLFAGTAGMGTLLYWSFVAVFVFYVGWACTAWARQRRVLHNNRGDSIRHG